MDDDVILRDGWWDEALKAFEDSKVGLFHGVSYDIGTMNNLTNFKISSNNIKRDIRIFSERGYGNNIAFRRETLIAIRKNYGIIPPELHLYEDAWLLRAVQCIKYKSNIGTVGILQFDPIKINRIDNASIYDIDIKHIKIASKYGIIRSANLPRDIFGLLAPVAGYLPWAIKNIKKLGLKDGIKVTNKKQYLKLLYKYVKVKSSLSFSCKKLVEQRLHAD